MIATTPAGPRGGRDQGQPERRSRVRVHKKIGEDKQSDIALPKSRPRIWCRSSLPTPTSCGVGDYALAIGNPFGLARPLPPVSSAPWGRSGLNIENLENFIQTDAAIQLGNSGGALLNLRGELIGINTAILGPNGGNIGIGFAIPSNMVRDLSEQIVKYGEVRRTS